MIDIKCNCGATTVIRTSYSKRNPGKLYYAFQGPLCKFIGWVNDYDQDCDCMAFRMKLEEQNRKLKFYLVLPLGPTVPYFAHVTNFHFVDTPSSSVADLLLFFLVYQ
ncbi:unnamed protein product [Lactuca saligna]|uniref:Zinc finger GRF-type domain-containing protein n=1 Tax=Lactuca saligna TaxID=75948 RepID=A0AA35Y9K6_LACSI|nr:unnamed protein product [Lactuca saligna]